MTTCAKENNQVSCWYNLHIPKINQYKSYLHVYVQCTGLRFCRALMLVTKVEYCFLSMYMWVENRLNPQQNIHSMSLKPFK